MIPLKDNLSCKVFPWVTIALLVLNFIGFGIELSMGSNLQPFLMKWTVVPAQFTHALVTGDIAAVMFGLLTMVTASFLHGGWMHIIGNMIFLQAFARSVEARMGSLRFAVFYLASCFAAWGLFLFSDPTAMVPALGASGAIAGVMGAYFALYPKAEFKTIILIQGWPLWGIIPAWSFLTVWGGMQFVSGWGAIMDPSAADSVAYWAHIGGFLFGLIAAGILALITPDTGICYVPLSCGCSCDGPCKKKNQLHRFRFLRWSDIPFFGRKDEEHCEHHHDHDKGQDGTSEDQGNKS
ncbi:MAG TPA: rhomboid family intramembrane serine protease [Candidatus Obscuribacterales bacterium]